MDFIVANKWAILLSLEVVAWTSTFLMMYTRYRLESPIWFKIFAGLTILTGVLPQVTLGIINFIKTNEIDLFTAIIVLLIVYGVTIGRKHVKMMDQWAQKKFSRAGA